MCDEQAPNPFAFSVGNADRVFEPYRAHDGLGRAETAALLKHLLVFYNVADRSWAISQDLIVGGRDVEGNDLTNDTSYALLDAYYDMNMPQPILLSLIHICTLISSECTKEDIINMMVGRVIYEEPKTHSHCPPRMTETRSVCLLYTSRCV